MIVGYGLRRQSRGPLKAGTWRGAPARAPLFSDNSPSRSSTRWKRRRKTNERHPDNKPDEKYGSRPVAGYAAAAFIPAMLEKFLRRIRFQEEPGEIPLLEEAGDLAQEGKVVLGAFLVGDEDDDEDLDGLFQKGNPESLTL